VSDLRLLKKSLDAGELGVELGSLIFLNLSNFILWFTIKSWIFTLPLKEASNGDPSNYKTELPDSQASYLMTVDPLSPCVLKFYPLFEKRAELSIFTFLEFI
jgi:hypothetical protein